MLLVDDLQWADDSTLDLVAVLLAGEHPGILMVFAARDGFAPSWPVGLVRHVELEPLSADELEAMALEIPQSAALAGAQRRRLVERSDGVPLYLEELARSTDALAWESRRPSSRAVGRGHPARATRPAARAPFGPGRRCRAGADRGDDRS